MKKLILLLMVALVSLIAVSYASAATTTKPGGDDEEKKVTICHVPPGNPENAHTITISVNALKAHLGDNDEGLHGGDYYGECKPIEPPPNPCPDGDFNGDAEGCGEPPCEVNCNPEPPCEETNTCEPPPCTQNCEPVEPPVKPPFVCPNGEEPIHGKDGAPGNDSCDPCAPPITATNCGGEPSTPPVVETPCTPGTHREGTLCVGNEQPTSPPPVTGSSTPPTSSKPPKQSGEQPTASTDEPSSPSKVSTTATKTETLPYTGFPLRYIVLLGVALVLAGLYLRRRAA